MALDEPEGAGRPRVLVVERRAAHGQHLVSQCRLAADTEVIRQISGLDQVLARIAEYRPDAVLLELGDLRGGDLSFLRGLRGGSAVPLILVTDRYEAPALAEAVDAGVSGVLPTSASADAVAGAVRVVKAGGFSIDPDYARGMVEEMEQIRLRTNREQGSLTPREREVLLLLAEGLSARQMARRLGLSERTVNTHVANVYRKLHVSNRVEALRAAMRLRMVSGP